MNQPGFHGMSSWALNVAHLEDGSHRNWIRRNWMGPSMYQAIKFPQPRGIGDENDHHDYTNLLTGMILQVGGEHEFMT